MEPISQYSFYRPIVYRVIYTFLLGWVLFYAILAWFIPMDSTGDPVLDKQTDQNAILVAISVTVIAALLALMEWFRSLRSANIKQKDLCTQCSYNLTGNTTGTCPECGHVIEKSPVESG